MTGYWSSLGMSQPFLLAGPGSRYAASCLTCGALVIVPTSNDDDIPEVLAHNQRHVMETYR